MDPQAPVIGHISAISEDILSQVPREFHQYLAIMGKEAADTLPED